MKNKTDEFAIQNIFMHMFSFYILPYLVVKVNSNFNVFASFVHFLYLISMCLYCINLFGCY